MTARRRVNGQIGLRVPANVSSNNTAKPTCAKANRHTAVTYSTMNDYAHRRAQYQSEFRGVYQLLPSGLQRDSHFGRLQSVMEMSLARTLRQSTSHMHGSATPVQESSWCTSTRERVCTQRHRQATGQPASHLAWRIWGGIPGVKRQRQAVLVDQQPNGTGAAMQRAIKRRRSGRVRSCATQR